MKDLWIYLIPIAIGLWIGWLLSKRRGEQSIITRMKILNIADFKQNMRKGQLIDLRKPALFEKDRIKGARNFRVGYLKNKSQVQVRKDQPLYLYCQKGNKSKRAAKKLLGRGYVFVYLLEGGFNAYNQLD